MYLLSLHWSCHGSAPLFDTTNVDICTLPGADGLLACDQCHAGYAGTTCERCADGFYGASDSCRPCDCSGNADPATAPRLCHPNTGRCLSCANNTAGVHCELCASGYAGDALRRGCMPAGEAHLCERYNSRPSFRICSCSASRVCPLFLDVSSSQSKSNQTTLCYPPAATK